MKNLINLLIPVLVVAAIFLISQAFRINYDIRYLTVKETTVVIINKEIIPAGTEHRMIKTGNTFQQIPVSHPVEPTLYFQLQNSESTVVVNPNNYDKIAIGSSITINYYKPKYYGKAFAFRLR